MDNLPGSGHWQAPDDGAPPEPAEHYILGAELDGGETQRAGGGPQRRGAPAVMAILITCTAVFVLSVGLSSIGLYILPERYLVFSPGNGLIFPGIITHMFAHANTMHILGNMFVLFFLGRIVEQSYGTPRFLALYFACGIIAALAEAAVAPTGLLLGASGAISGVMAAFVRHYPRTMLYVYGILPVPAWLFIAFWLGLNLWGAGGGMGQSIAFCAHLGGFVAGIVLSLLLVPPGKSGVFVRQLP
jgi:membrane associated rhomboid family serine protease